MTLPAYRPRVRWCRRCVTLYTHTTLDAAGYVVLHPCGCRLRKAPTHTTPPRETEAAFQAWVTRLARLYQWTPYHTRRSEGSDPGFPDLVLYRWQGPRVRVVVAELKSATGRLTPAQRGWLDALAGAGYECYCWRPRDRDAVHTCLGRPGAPVAAGRWPLAPA